jgi:hypothetical protein
MLGWNQTDRRRENLGQQDRTTSTASGPRKPNLKKKKRRGTGLSLAHACTLLGSRGQRKKETTSALSFFLSFFLSFSLSFFFSFFLSCCRPLLLARHRRGLAFLPALSSAASLRKRGPGAGREGRLGQVTQSRHALRLASAKIDGFPPATVNESMILLLLRPLLLLLIFLLYRLLLLLLRGITMVAVVVVIIVLFLCPALFSRSVRFFFSSLGAVTLQSWQQISYPSR